MKALFLAAVIVVLIGCEEQPGETFRGTLQADADVVLPVSGKKVCAGQIQLWETRKSGQRSHSVWTTGAPKWGSNMRLVVDGETLTLGPEPGRVKLSNLGDQWTWRKGKTVPDALWGWGAGVDRTLKSVSGPDAKFINHRLIRIDADEYFTNCGETVRVRAIRKGNVLHPVDTNKVTGRNVLTFWLCGFVGFFLFLILPMAFLIFWVVKRSKRNKNQTG